MIRNQFRFGTQGCCKCGKGTLLAKQANEATEAKMGVWQHG